MIFCILDFQEHGKEMLDKWKLERVDENFRVIALGIPIPR